MKSESPSIVILPNGTLKLRLGPAQFKVFHCPARFRVVVAGRRFGKTELALAEIVKTALLAPNLVIWYVGPSEKQAKDIVWTRLKEITQEWQAQKPHETEQRIQLFNNSIIVVKGAFDPDSLRGQGLDFIVLDEVADLKPEAWHQVLRPSLADRKGRALFIGTPKGRNHFYDQFESAKNTPDWAAFHFTTEDGGLVDKSELQIVGSEIDSNLYRREFDAEFTVAGDYRAYLSFDPILNVREVRFEISLPLIWALDFNVDPMCMLVMQKNGEDIHVLQEITVRSNAITTAEACKIFMERVQPYLKLASRVYGIVEVHAYGDASGNQRRTSAAATDWTIIRNFFQSFHRGEVELSCHESKMNPLVRDRINCVNARLKNNNSEQHLFIHPSCKELKRDLEEVSYTTDSTGAPTRELNKSDRNRTHMSDALGYYVSNVFPLKGFFSF